MKSIRLLRPGVIGVLMILVVSACSSNADSEDSSTTTAQPTDVRSGADSSTSSTTTTTAPATSSSSTTTTTTSPPSTSTSPTVTGEGPIGVVGCSNTGQAVVGYTDASSLDRLSFGDLGGGAASIWGDPTHTRYSLYWDLYDTRRPAEGYDETWVQLCIRSGDHEGVFDDDEMAWITHIVEQLNERDPGIVVWISPLNSYEGIVCDSVGEIGPEITAQASDWAASTLSGVARGPDLGPLTPDMIGVRDNCHPNKSGEALLGSQLVAFFD